MMGHEGSKPLALPVVGDENAEFSRLMIGGECQSGKSDDILGSPMVDLGDDRYLTSPVDLATAGDPLLSQPEGILEPFVKRCTATASEHIRDKRFIFVLERPQHHDRSVFELGSPLYERPIY
jgi:hypothetical protein